MSNSISPAAGTTSARTRRMLAIVALMVTSCTSWVLGMNYAYIKPAFDDGDLSGYYVRQDFGIWMFAILMVMGIVSISIACYALKYYGDTRNTKTGRNLAAMAIVAGAYLITFSGGALFKLIPWVINR